MEDVIYQDTIDVAWQDTGDVEWIGTRREHGGRRDSILLLEEEEV